jgi:hypothetical protein
MVTEMSKMTMKTESEEMLMTISDTSAMSPDTTTLAVFNHPATTSIISSSTVAACSQRDETRN